MIKKLRSLNGWLISARNLLMCFEVITIRMGLSEDGVNRQRNGKARKLRRKNSIKI
jgi:hypothetical protein